MCIIVGRFIPSFNSIAMLCAGGKSEKRFFLMSWRTEKRVRAAEPIGASGPLVRFAAQFSSLFAHIGSFLSLPMLLNLHVASRKLNALVSSNRVLWTLAYNRSCGHETKQEDHCDDVRAAERLRKACVLRHG